MLRLKVEMDKKPINLNNLENFLKKAKSKLNEGIEDIGQANMNKLDQFLSEISNEKINKLKETNSNFSLAEFDLFDKKIKENNSFEFINGGKIYFLCNNLRN